MTPLAAQLFRKGDEVIQRGLAASQFFECTKILPMACEMLNADVKAGCDIYSEFAQLPAPDTVLEFIYGGLRLMASCVQKDDAITFVILGSIAMGYPAEFICETGFRLGTGENLHSTWSDDAVMVMMMALDTGLDRQTFMVEQARAFNGAIEKMLCILNQPGLVDRRGRDTDRRVLRMAPASAPVPLKWHECRIRPGVHGKASDTAGEGREHQLHYVRKHYKPSVGKWIEGYWRGNADLGIYLKHYSVQSPRAA